jgi:lipoprotein-anchoring transpeptidase ErfK/SrfK
MQMRRRTAVAVLAAVLSLVVGCGQTEPGDAAAPVASSMPSTTSTAEPGEAPPEEPAFPAYAATVTGSSIAVHDGPGGAQTSSLDNPLPSGAPLTFLLVEDHGEWLNVLLPVRPNGSTGWVRAADVVLEGVPYRLDVRTADHQLDLYEFDRLVRSYPVGIGKTDTPTPGGTFYLKELLEPPDKTGLYGPFAYGLSGFSTTLDTFAGGEAVIGLHGTNDPTSIGKDVSSGCIRLRNEDITELTTFLPLGTPVRILA